MIDKAFTYVIGNKLQVMAWIAVVVVLGWLMWTVNGWKNDADKLADVQKDFAEYRADAEKSRKLAEENSKYAKDQLASTTNIMEELANDIRKNAAYVRCPVPADGLRLINEAAAKGQTGR